MEREKLYVGVVLLLLGLIVGCATTGGGPGREVPAIPAGKGHLVLEAGGIEELDFSVFDQETGEKVTQLYGLHTYLDPGIYRVEVETDFTYADFRNVVLDDVEIVVGQEKHVQVPVGRFMINVIQESDQTQQLFSSGRIRLPFRVYDFGRRTVLLDRGLTSTQVKYFIAPIGDYKVELTPRSGSSIDHIIRPIEVRFGRPYPVTIQLGGDREAPPSE